jgi:hypothetical protein
VSFRQRPENGYEMQAMPPVNVQLPVAEMYETVINMSQTL